MKIHDIFQKKSIQIKNSFFWGGDYKSDWGKNTKMSKSTSKLQIKY